MTCYGNLLFWYHLFHVLGASHICMGVFPSFENVSFYDSVNDVLYAIDVDFFSLDYAYHSKVWFSMVTHISYGFLSCIFLCLFLIWSRSSLSLKTNILSSAWFLLLVKPSSEFSSWVISVFNFIFIATWVIFKASLSLLNPFLKSWVTLSLLSALCLCFLRHHIVVFYSVFILLILNHNCTN